MEIAVIGAGAMGSMFGGFLQHTGHSVYLVDIWEEHVDRINDNGLLIESHKVEDTTVDISATTDLTEVGSVDVVFVFVKSQHTEAAIRNANSEIGSSTTVVTLQNGFTNYDILVEELGADRVIGGATTASASMEGPGHVLQTGFGETTIGGENDAVVDRLAAAMTEAGLETNSVDDPLPYIWDKQLISVGIKPPAALTGLKDGPLGEYRETACVMELLIEEAVAVAEAKGVEIICEDPVERIYDICEANYATKSSILVDVENERPTEIDYINGAIVTYGEEFDIPTPYNRIATYLVKGKEHSYLDDLPGTN